MWLIRKEVFYLLRILGHRVTNIYSHPSRIHQNQELQSRQLALLDSKEHPLGRHDRRILGASSDCLPHAGVLLAKSLRMHSSSGARLTFRVYVLDSSDSS